MTELQERVRETMDEETTEEEANVVAIYSRIAELKAELKKIEGDARERATDLYEGYGLTVLQGADGVVTIKKRGAGTRLDTKLVRKMLTKKQIEQASVPTSATLVMSFTGRGT
jgi:hypothetical protein